VSYSRAIGQLGELKFITEATAMGLVVSMPFLSSQPYDVIVDSGGNLFRVQIKSTARHVHTETLKFIISRGSDTKKPYNADDFDVLALVAVHMNKFWLIPSHSISHLTTLAINESDPKNKFNNYFANWEIFL
jgi:hypothetical protein